MRRLAPFFGIALLLAGCGGAKTVSPTAKTVIGSVPTNTQASVPAGDAKSGATVFMSNGCGGCHKFTPAGTNKTIGPDLDKLAQYAKQAKQPLAAFTKQSIVDPGAYVQPGYPKGVMPATYGKALSAEQITQLVDFLTKPQGG